MAQAWQQTLEGWWQGLLGDPDRLRDLARVLSEAGFGGGGKSASRSEDLQRVVEALELIEQRQKSLEEQVRSLTENLAAVVSFLERDHKARADGDGDGDGEIQGETSTEHTP